MIPFFLRHYEPLVNRMVIFDDGSTDASEKLWAASPKVELRRLASGPSTILMHIEELNRCWKESRGRADWVIICDIDEHIYHPRLREYLEQAMANEVTMLKPVGIDMISPTFPPANAVLCETIRCGVRSFLLDKTAVFDPAAIEEINYTPGRHLSAPIGRVILPPRKEVKLLHYKNLGLGYLLQRSKELRGRKTEYDRERGWALHDYRSDDHITRDFEKMRSEAQDISLIGKRRAASP